MKRTITTIAMLIVVLFSTLHNAHAATITNEVHSIFIADYDNGMYYAALQSMDGDSYRAIKFNAVNEQTHEDMLPVFSTITITLNMDDHGYTGIATMYSAAYNKLIEVSYSTLDDSDIGTIANVNTQNGITDGTVNGEYAQFTHGFVTNGSMFLLRDANAYATNGTGYIVQNGNLISYVVSNGESTPTYTVLLPVILF